MVGAKSDEGYLGDGALMIRLINLCKLGKGKAPITLTPPIYPYVISFSTW